MNGWLTDFRDFLARPFREDMDAGHWFLLIGLIIVCIVAWNVMLSHLLNAIRKA